MACDPNVVIGAKWVGDDGGLGALAGSAATTSGGAATAGATSGGAGGGTSAGTEAVGASASDSGAPGAGAAGAPASVEQWCATAPWVNKPVQFTGESGNAIPAGNYVITYESGAQIHDLEIGYEVTGHYFGKNMIEAGHHLYSGDSPETGLTSLWLDDQGLVVLGATASVAEVENANRGHSWPLVHAGGELFITLYDDDYHDNSGPGSRLCIAAAPQ